MTEKSELVALAEKCRWLSVRSDDEATVRSLDRLADHYETQARIIDHLASCARPDPGPRARTSGVPASVAASPVSVAPASTVGHMLAPRA